MTRASLDSTHSKRILIVDDDPSQRSLLETFLRSQGFVTVGADCGAAALDLLQRGPFDLMVSDVRMPGISGLETMRRARAADAQLPILLVTAYADVRDAVEAMRDGAIDYLAKPVDFDELLVLVRRATGIATPTGQAATEAPLPPLPLHVVAESPVLKSVLRDAALVAAADSRVLITGESGTGKEVIAELIHAWSPRSNGPLVAVNCAAIPESLLESELFGHEKGAFTGALQARAGRFEEARNGTIFLDEIGEMSPALQAKLLRVTQDGRFRRLGASSELQCNARIIAATNIDLDQRIKEGRFREDLYYRLSVVELNLPPLRERPEDVLALASRFLELQTRGKIRLSNEAAQAIRGYSWPGNVRELRNAMERAALLCRGEVVLPEHLPGKIRGAIPKPLEPSLPEVQRLDELERDAILEALRKQGFNRTETAKTLAISRRTLTYKLQRLREQGCQVDPPRT